MSSIERESIQIADLAARLDVLEQAGAGATVTPFRNLLPNGGFDSAIGYTLGTGWSIGSGVATAAGGTSDGNYLDTSFGWDLTEYYRFSASFAGTMNGTNYFTPRFGGPSDVSPNAIASGLYTNAFYPGGTGLLRIRSEASANTLTVDNMALWYANPDNDAAWLRLPRGHVLAGPFPVIRDGVVLHPDDYTIRKRPDQWFIEPVTAPGHATEFLVATKPGV